MNKLENYQLKNGVYILSAVNTEFEKLYLKVREIEKRIYSDEEVARLPFASINNPHNGEWKLRQKSFNRFKLYLSNIKTDLTMFDLGCGNGWFSGQLSKRFNHTFYGFDINIKELEQAARVFKNKNLNYCYADIYEDVFTGKYFDLIILNSSIQYFSDINKLIEKLFYFLADNGEIHIIDSPFYPESEIQSAKERTKKYYENMNAPEMADKYFHHSFKTLERFNYKLLYKPKKILGRIFQHESPFPWIRIIK